MTALLRMLTRGDGFVDLSLRILTIVIVAVLLFSLGLLLWRVLSPPQPGVANVPVIDVAPKATSASEPVTAPTPPKAEVLLDPGKVYRCVVNGRTTFSERPCPASAAQPPAGKR